MRRTFFAFLCLFVATVLFIMAVLEISFPQIFAWSNLLESVFPALWRYRIHVGLVEVAVSGLLLWPAFRFDARLSERVLETASRVGLGGMFIFSSWFKIQNPQGFAMLVAQYQFLPSWSVNLFALFMPQLEMLTGIVLIFTRWNREASALLLAMFFAFIVALGQAVFRNLGITCGCFEIEGAVDKKEAWISLVRDLILLAPTVWLVFRPDRSLWNAWRSKGCEEVR